MNVLVLPDRHACVEKVGRGFLLARSPRTARPSPWKKELRSPLSSRWPKLSQQTRLNFAERHRRKLRIEYAGAIYHVMSRANGKGDVFLNAVDRQDFLKTLAEACQKTGFQVHAYCLTRNHFHLVVETLTLGAEVTFGVEAR